MYIGYIYREGLICSIHWYNSWPKGFIDKIQILQVVGL